MPIRLPPGRALIFLALLAALGLSVLPLGPARHSSYYFSETDHAVSGRFLDTWIGGHTYTDSIRLNGYPISDPLTQTNALDGKPYRVQWFQRVRLEAHPDQTPPNDVALGQLGRESGIPAGVEAAFAKLPAAPAVAPTGNGSRRPAIWCAARFVPSGSNTAGGRSSATRFPKSLASAWATVSSWSNISSAAAWNAGPGAAQCKT